MSFYHALTLLKDVQLYNKYQLVYSTPLAAYYSAGVIYSPR